MTTGVILIKGKFWKQWAEYEFAPLKTVIEKNSKGPNDDKDFSYSPSTEFLFAVESISGSSKKNNSSDEGKEGKTDTPPQ